MSQPSLNRIILTIGCVINLLVAVNTFLHNPFIGYDLVGPFRLRDGGGCPSAKPIRLGEYYSPPLPYFLPSLIFQLCKSDTITCKFIAGKFAQGINLIFSIGITVFLLKIAELIRPKNQPFKIATLLIFALFTVYYKTFSQVRGEPYLAFFEGVAIDLALKLAGCQKPYPLRIASSLGSVLVGLA